MEQWHVTDIPDIAIVVEHMSLPDTDTLSAGGDKQETSGKSNVLSVLPAVLLLTMIERYRG